MEGDWKSTLRESRENLAKAESIENAVFDLKAVNPNRANNDDRRRVMRQLNKGEALHDLRSYLMIANKGQLRRKRSDELVNQASSLNLVTNAVIVWNTVYMAEAVAQLKREEYPIQESDLAHIWPTRYEHINVYGRYHFNIEEAQGRKGLRPLRQAG